MTSSPESIKHYMPVLLERFIARQQHRRQHNRRTNRKPLHINRHNVVPIGGPEQELAVGARLLSTAEFAVFDNKEANALLIDAEAQVKSGFPTIATSSMVARRTNAPAQDDMEFPPHIRFLNELVKPVQYRWKFQRERAKLLSPSKHGFHPRSQSPTFRRLLDATERLQVMLEQEAADALEKPNASGALETERQLASEAIKGNSVYRRAKSDRSSARTSLQGTECTPPVKRLELHQREHPHRCEYKVTEPAIQEDESEGNDYDYDDEFETVDETPDPELPPPAPQPVRPTPRHTFKVDFKKMDSHSELHLFLPIIQDGLSRGATPDIPTVQPIHDTSDLVLPTIDDTAQHKNDKKEKSKKEQKSPSEITKKRKKKFLHRTKSGNEEKVADILNDVPTLISMENEKNEPSKEETPRPAMLVIPKQHHSSAMCVFENCVFHSNLKSVKIRQA